MSSDEDYDDRPAIRSGGRSAGTSSSSSSSRRGGRNNDDDDDTSTRRTTPPSSTSGRKERPKRRAPNRRNVDEPDEATRAELGLDNDRDDDARTSSGRSGGGGGGARQTQMRAEEKRSTSSALDEAIRSAAEAEKSGAQTLNQLAVQHDQMNTMRDDLHATNESLTRSERVLKGMKSITGAIGNMFSSAPKAEPPPKASQFAGGERKGADILARTDMLKKEGFLIKMGDVIKNWKNRFFVIDKNVLYYYEDDKAYKTKGIAAAKGKISLTGLTITPYPDKLHGKKYCFGVKAADTERTYVLVAANEEERAAWMSALKEQTRRVSVALTQASWPDGKRPTLATGGTATGDTAQDRFNRSIQQEEHEDDQLEVLSGMMGNLGRQGDNIHRELTVQNDLLDEIDHEVERTTVRLAKNTRVVNKITRDA